MSNNSYITVQDLCFTDEAFQAKFPTGTKFECLPGEPVAEKLTLTGKTILGESLTAEYVFVDPMGRAESGSTAVWESCESEDFASSEVFLIKTENCSNGVPMTYVMQELDDGKYIRCTVTPRNADTTLNEGFPMAPFRTDNDRTHFKSYDSATGVYSGEYNFAPMIRAITATNIAQGVSTISVNARDYDDNIQSVEVFVDNVSIGNAVQSAYDTWELDWNAATAGEHQIHAIATDVLGTTNVAGHSTLGNQTVSPVKYAVNLKIDAPSLFGKFTNLTDGEIASFGTADGVKITTVGEGKLILAAYNGNTLVKCVITDEKSASLTAKDIEGATTIKAFLFEAMTTLRPVTTPVSINK